MEKSRNFGVSMDGTVYDSHSGWWLPEKERHLQDWMRRINDRDTGGRRLLYQGIKFRTALLHVPAHRRRLAVDVGAHVGLWSFQMVQKFQRVIAFEPVPLHAKCWRKNMNPWEHPHVDLREIALGAAPGKAWLKTRTADSSGDTGIEPNGEGDVEALVSTLDQQLVDEPHVDFLKIDCEGFEVFVLKGGEQIIKSKLPVIIVEQKPETGMVQRYGISSRDAVDWLGGLGYKVLKVLSGDYIMGAQT